MHDLGSYSKMPDLGEVFCKIKTLRGLFAMFRSQQTVKFRSKKKACMARERAARAEDFT